jgi:hypothetical protein
MLFSRFPKSRQITCRVGPSSFLFLKRQSWIQHVL